MAIERASQTSEAPRSQRADELCNGGLDRLAAIEIVPDAVVTIAGREQVEYHSEISLRRGKRVGVAWRADITDDRGNVVVARLDSGSYKGAAGQVALGNAFKLPLADGFYALRVRAAVTADDAPADVVEAAQHIEVDAGRWIEIDDQEWFARSRAAQAFTAAELAARGLL